MMLTRDGVYSEMAGDAYIEAVAEKESSNLLLNELLRLDCSMDDPDDLEDEGAGGADTNVVKPQGGGKTCRKEKATKTEKRNPKK